MTPGQSLALSQLQEIAAVDGYSLELEGVKQPTPESPSLTVEINIHIGRIETVETGLHLRERETFYLVIPPRFPFQHPHVWVDHDRFAGKPHVQWVHHLCLYQSSSEWNPSDGIFGLITRLQVWLNKAAIDQLDPVGQALHPPAVYTDVDVGKLVIPRANTPSFAGPFWIGFARVRDRPKFMEIIDWCEPESAPADAEYALALLFGDPLPWEYPRKGDALFRECSRQGVSEQLLFRLLKIASLLTPEGKPLYIILGAPMRGISGGVRTQHLSVWAIDPTRAESVRTSVRLTDDTAEVAVLRMNLERLLVEVLHDSKISWCPVIEDRPEVTIRRDCDSALSYFRGKSVSIWGCGALGAYIALYICRAGARRLTLRDRDIVNPGILVRQSYLAEDVADSKVDALRRQLISIRPDLEVFVQNADLERALSVAGFDWTDGCDVVIDATASDLVRRRLEMVWSQSRRVPLGSLMINHTAGRLLVGVVGSDHSGGVWHLWRNTKIKLLRNLDLAPFADSFFPSEIREKPFQPEPGCSEPTFIGSAGDSAGLAGIGLNLIARELATISSDSAVSYLFAQPTDTNLPLVKSSARFEFQSDFVLLLGDQETRVCPAALGEIKSWISQNRRLRGNTKETGGLLWGEWDDSTGIVWVTHASGPPPDSEHNEDLFLCGVEGTREEHARRTEQSRLSVGYIGMWHTHPVSRPFPSDVDITGMHRIFTSGAVPPRKNLLIIIGRDAGKDTLGAYLFRRISGDEISAKHELKLAQKPLPEQFL